MPAELLTRAETERAAAFVRRVVGLPWREDANGPDAYDCWGIAKLTQRELFGRELPVTSRDPAEIVEVFARVLRGDRDIGWAEVKRGLHGDLVTLRHALHPQHIGTWLALDRGKLLHSYDKAGVCFDPRPMLEFTGWGRFRFFRYVGPNAPAMTMAAAA